MSTPVEWRDTRFSGYLVSSDGEVRGRRGSILKQRLNDGYPQVKMSVHGWRKVHQLVCEAWNGPCPPGLVTRHRDGDRLNNLPGNLCWGTHSENQKDRIAHGGLTPRLPGALNPNSRITAEIAEGIRQAYRRKEGSQTKIGARFGISQTQVSRIIRGEQW
jgi:hypothetical protein